MRDVWLIRHAESLANIGEATPTPREIPLSDNGFRQADELGEMIEATPDLIVISPYTRAQQTAAPLIERFPDVPVETLPVQEFTYLSITRSRGTNSQQRKPWVDEYWQRSDPNYCDGGQAESFAEFLSRLNDFVRVMRDRECGLAFVFTHEQVIKALMWQRMGFAAGVDADSMRAFQKFMVSFHIPNASVTKVKVGDDGQWYFGKIGGSING